MLQGGATGAVTHHARSANVGATGAVGAAVPATRDREHPLRAANERGDRTGDPRTH